MCKARNIIQKLLVTERGLTLEKLSKWTGINYKTMHYQLFSAIEMKPSYQEVILHELRSRGYTIPGDDTEQCKTVSDKILYLNASMEVFLSGLQLDVMEAAKDGKLDDSEIENLINTACNVRNNAIRLSDEVITTLQMNLA